MNLLQTAALTVSVLLTAMPAIAQKQSISLLKTTATDGCRTIVQRQGTRQMAALEQMIDAIEQSLPGAVNDTNKFDVIDRNSIAEIQDLIASDDVLANANDPRVAQAFNRAGAQYVITVAIVDYTDNQVPTPFPDETVVRRELDLAATITVINTESGTIARSLEYRPEQKAESDILPANVGKDVIDTIGNKHVIAFGDEAGKGIADMLLEYFFPMESTRMRGDMLSINRGSASGLQQGDRLEILEGTYFEDTTTGEMLLEEWPMGFAEVDRVSIQTSIARVTEGDPAELQAIIDDPDKRLLLRRAR